MQSILPGSKVLKEETYHSVIKLDPRAGSCLASPLASSKDQPSNAWHNYILLASVCLSEDLKRLENFMRDGRINTALTRSLSNSL